jgi:type I restriction enzyme S subunit
MHEPVRGGQQADKEERGVMLPSGWKQARLDSLASVERGKFSARPRNDPKYFGGEIPFVQTGDVANARLYLLAHSQTLNSLGVTVSKVFEEGTILLTIAANIGATAITQVPTACPDSVVGIRPLSTNTDLLWLKYALADRQRDLNVQAGQNAQKNINLEVLKPLRIATPPLKEQQRIGEILLTWDQAIVTMERLLANSQRHTRDLMASLFSGHRRFPGLSDKWRSVDFDSVFARVTRKNTMQNTNVLTISAEHGLISQRDYFNKSVASANLTGYTLLNRHDFAYNKSYSAGYPMGAIKPLLAYEAGVVSSLYLCFRLREEVEADFDFFRHYFEAGLLNKEIEGIAQEGARNHGLLNVSVSDFFKLQLHIPSAPEQRRIAEVINVAKAAEARLEAQLQSLRQEKVALMSQLLTGKRRVKLPESEPETELQA